MTISGHMLRMAAAATRSDIPTVPGTPYGGGFYIGDITIGSDVWALVVADKAAEDSMFWKTTRTASAGTESVDDGWANTNAMNDASHPAAQYCRAYTDGIYTDWYLWSEAESGVAWDNLPPGGSGTPNDFKTGGSQAFSATPVHWTSTQSTSNTAMARNRSMSGGLMNDNFKNASYLVRPIRRVKRN